MSKTKKLTISAMLVAMATVLMLFSKLIPAPWLQGGSITLASMVPIITISLIIDTKWGLISGFVFSLIQMISGFYPPPTQDFISFFLVVMLDYVLAFGLLGSAGFFFKLFNKKRWAIPICGFIVTSIRYICHILSGILIWHVYAGEQTVIAYAVTYNGTYMVPEIIISTVALAAISGFIMKYTNK